MRDTADHEEDWGDSNSAELDVAMVSAGLMHDVKYSSLAAAYRAEDARIETEHMSIKFKYLSGKPNLTNMVFKEAYRDEYTNEELPIGHVRAAMKEELEYFCDKVWVGVPLSEAQNDPDGKIIGSRWVNCNKNDINDHIVRRRSAYRQVQSSKVVSCDF